MPISRIARHTLAQLVLVCVSCGGVERAREADSAGGGSSNGGTGASGSSTGGQGATAGSGAGTAGTSAAGAAGAGMLTQCGGLMFEMPDVDVRTGRSGTNGDFVDECGDGFLIEYTCAVEYRVVSEADPGAWPFATGEVMATSIDCGGRCRDGVCPNVCPAVGDSMRYASIEADGHTVLEDTTTGFNYSCRSSGSSSVAGYDCATSPQVGDVMQVTYPYDPVCANSVTTLAIGRDGMPYCGYADCSIVTL